jgi:hypothetical protein
MMEFHCCTNRLAGECVERMLCLVGPGERRVLSSGLTAPNAFPDDGTGEKRQGRRFLVGPTAFLLLGGSRKLFGNVHFAEAESPCNGITGTLFAFQHFVEPTAINMMPLRKGGLTPFTFNGDSQHAMQVVLVEYDCAATTP